MPLFLLSRALASPNGFWSTCLWNVPESFSKKLIHHISDIEDEEDRFTAELRVRLISRLNPCTRHTSILYCCLLTLVLQNLSDALRWTAGLPAWLRSQVIIVVVGDNMRRGASLPLVPLHCADTL